MRGLKFRAYVSKESRYNLPVGMIKPETIKRIQQNKLTEIPGEWCWEECGLIFMQYTGIKDSNGVEIYEGDIVRCIDNDTVSENIPLALGGYDITGVIEYYQNFFALKANTTYLSYWPNAENIEVVGNIYESNHTLP